MRFLPKTSTPRSFDELGGIALLSILKNMYMNALRGLLDRYPVPPSRERVLTVGFASALSVSHIVKPLRILLMKGSLWRGVHDVCILSVDVRAASDNVSPKLVHDMLKDWGVHNHLVCAILGEMKGMML